MTKLIALLKSFGTWILGEAAELEQFDAKARAKIEALVAAKRIKAGFIGLGIGVVIGFLLRGGI